MSWEMLDYFTLLESGHFACIQYAYQLKYSKH